MSLKIENIAENSLAEKYGLKKNDIIISINSHLINDFVDLQFYGADPILTIKYRNEKGNSQIILEQNWEIPLGIEPEEYKCQTCINDCIFCFIDQMRPDLRKNLYVKDDDFLLSFVYGNFITLTNLTEKDYQKIFVQKISPLYISVHTTNPELHKKIFRYNLPNFNIFDKLSYLSDNNIEFHAQIVIIPGLNDGIELENTLHDLSLKNLNTLSIGIVPVGLTRYRKILTNVERVDKKQAKKILEISEKYPRTYCADEIYLLADKSIPPDEFYDDYPQLENGIGMLRLLWENWNFSQDDFINDIKKSRLNPVLITSELAYPYFQKISNEISKKTNMNPRTIKITNNYFGDSVTVAGLLTAEDIFAQVKLNSNEIACVSSNIFNSENVTLDNLSKYEFKKYFSGNLLVIDEEFADWEFI